MSARRLVAIAVVVAACSGGGNTMTITGSLIDLRGDLEQVEQFTVVTPDAEQLTFRPAPGLTFHGGPLSHLSDHLRSGAMITVEYRDEGGRLVAIRVGDG